MGILKRIGKAIVNEVSKPKSFVKGEAFERYVEEVMFPSSRYEIIEKTHSYNTNKKGYVQSSMKPDFKFRCKETRKEFFVEAKFRIGEYFKDKIEWCNQNQLKRYQQINNNDAPVFICLGIGDNASKPLEVFVIPMAKLKFTGLYDSFLDKYSFHLDKPVFSSHLWKHQST